MDDQNLTPNNLKKTSEDFRELGDKLTKRVLIMQDELRKLRNDGASQTVIDAKEQDIASTQSQVNNCFTKATELGNKAALNVLISTNVTNAATVLGCSAAKVKLAVDRLKKTGSALKFVAAFVNVGAAIVTLGTSGGGIATNIKNLIDSIDKLSEQETDGLNDSEKAKLKKKCR